ncbi:hypothetical protein TWF281_011014 [Arthrobotrys megalospora]
MRNIQVILLLVGAYQAFAHWTHPLFTFNGQTSTEWQYVRLTTNRWTGDPIQNVNDPQMRCYHQAIPVTSTASVSAGSTVAFSVNSVVGHPGALMFYMAKVPSGQTINSFDGSGKVWFKIYQDAPTYDANGVPSWSTYGTKLGLYQQVIEGEANYNTTTP